MQVITHLSVRTIDPSFYICIKGTLLWLDGLILTIKLSIMKRFSASLKLWSKSIIYDFFKKRLFISILSVLLQPIYPILYMI